MLCTVRECEDDKHFQLSFEIIAPGSRSYVLQAESTEELRQWMTAIRQCIEDELIHASGSPTAMSRVHTISTMRPEIQAILEANPTCVDCRAPDPDWASINLGVVVCIACSGVHRSMGSHISQVCLFYLLFSFAYQCSHLPLATSSTHSVLVLFFVSCGLP